MRFQPFHEHKDPFSSSILYRLNLPVFLMHYFHIEINKKKDIEVIRHLKLGNNLDFLLEISIKNIQSDLIR